MFERSPLETVWLMNNHQFDLSAGESIRLGAYTITLLEIEGEAAVLEIEGPDGQELAELNSESLRTSETSNEEPVLV